MTGGADDAGSGAVAGVARGVRRVRRVGDHRLRRPIGAVEGCTEVRRSGKEVASNREPARRPGIREVEERSGDLRPRRDGFRSQGPGPSDAGSASRQAGEPRGDRCVGDALVGKDRLDLANRDRPEPDPDAARPDRRQELVLAVDAEDDRHARRWLLQRLEQRRLGVLVQAIRPLDERHPRAAFDRQER